MGGSMKIGIWQGLSFLLIGIVWGGTSFATTPDVEFVPGEYVVKLKQGSQIMGKSDLVEALSAEFQRTLTRDGRTVLVQRPMVERTEAAIDAIMQSEIVEYAEPNYIYRAIRLPNDPRLGDLWGLINEGGSTESDTARANIDIDAEKAWELTTGSQDVVVAVIDTGVDYTIKDLAPNIWVNEAEQNGQAGVDDDGNGFVDDIHGYDFVNTDGDPMDDHGHGSHCSGTIGAKGDDGEGVVGVNWNVRIMGLKFLSSSGGGSLSDAVMAIDYATNNGAHIMSNSWGGGGYSQALEEAIQRAEQAGILFVAAAGNHSANNDENPTFPANYELDNVMSVAAIDSAGDLASFSCYGKETVHVGAPGVNILSTTSSGLKSWSGTSMATPHVSGVAALLLAYDPSLSYSEVKERLMTTARPISGLRNRVKSGLVNAYHALTNTTPEVDPDDPYYWPTQEYALSTAHPYNKETNESWTVTIEGVNRFSLYFERFETETNYDKVTFSTPSGEVLGVWTGVHDDSFSPVVEGNVVVITLTSDRSVQKYGFDITAVAVE
jgi:subtilisin family serine protease